MNNTKKKEQKSNSWIFLLLICVTTCFIGIGYAKINDITFNIEGNVAGEPQNHIFITDVKYVSNNNTEMEDSSINSYYQTMLNSSIVLSPTDENSSITYEVTIYNSNTDEYCFVETLFDEEFYDNNNIKFELSGIERGQRLQGKEYVTFSLTFKYVDDVDMEGEEFNNILNSYLNFDFEKNVYPILANKMVPVYYESNEWKKIEKTSNKWYNFYTGKWPNAINYNNQLLYNQADTIIEGKSFDGTSEYVSLGGKNAAFGTNISLVSRFKISEYGTETQIFVGNIESGGFYLGLTSANKIRFRLYFEDGTNIMLTSPTKVDLNTWYNVVGTYDGTTMKLYVDGELVDSEAKSSTILASAAPIVLGGNPAEDGTVTAAYFKGMLAEVIVMKDSLEEAEIIENYGINMRHNPTKHNVLYYLKFDGDNGILCNGANYGSDGIEFDGVDDNISVGYSLYDFNNTFTIGARFMINEYSDEEYTIWGNPQTAGMNLFKSTANEITFAIYDKNTEAYINRNFINAPELKTWYTIIASYDGSTLKLYLNGTEVVSEKISISMVPSKPEFMIGVNTTVNSKLGGGYFNGVISDVLLIDEAISSEQISTYYSSNLRSVISDKTLVSYDLRGYEYREDGTIIPDEMINMMWVWIPRFNAITPTKLGRIDVELVDVTEDAHDAFNFADESIKGFWIGKFENCTNFNSENLDNTIFIKPNQISWTNNSIKAMFNSIKNIDTLKEKYGFDANETKTLDFHLIKNDEWGAISYFSHSKCGISRDKTYIEVSENASNYQTGGDDYTVNVEQSTTGNVYGIYDMVGGANEFVMANYNDSVNNYFDVLPNKKYYNTYTTEDNYNVNKFQHAMFETNSFYNTSTSKFVDSTNLWLVRNSLFSYDSNTGEANSSIGSRSVLIIK